MDKAHCVSALYSSWILNTCWAVLVFAPDTDCPPHPWPPPPPPPPPSLRRVQGHVLCAFPPRAWLCNSCASCKCLALNCAGCTDHVVFIPFACAALLPSLTMFLCFCFFCRDCGGSGKRKSGEDIVPDCRLNAETTFFPPNVVSAPRWFWHIIICLWSWTGRLQHVRLVTAWFQGCLFWKADGFSWSRSKFFSLMMVSVTLQTQLWSNLFSTLVTYEAKTGNKQKKSVYNHQIFIRGSQK